MNILSVAIYGAALVSKKGIVNSESISPHIITPDPVNQYEKKNKYVVNAKSSVLNQKNNHIKKNYAI